METTRTTPSSTVQRSRASTTVPDSIASSTPAPRPPHIITITPSLSDSQSDTKTPSTVANGQDAFKPLQLLMETEITIEYGKNLKGKRMIHQKLWCCYSPPMQAQFHKAKDLRARYPLADDMRRQLKALVCSVADFDTKHLESKVRQYALEVYESSCVPWKTSQQSTKPSTIVENQR
jgi:hypothetical protein